MYRGWPPAVLTAPPPRITDQTRDAVSRSRERRFQHRKQFLDVVVRIPYMRRHAHGLPADGDIDIGSSETRRQVGRDPAAEAQSEIMARPAVVRYAADAELGSMSPPSVQ